MSDNETVPPVIVISAPCACDGKTVRGDPARTIFLQGSKFTVLWINNNRYYRRDPEVSGEEETDQDGSSDGSLVLTRTSSGPSSPQR